MCNQLCVERDLAGRWCRCFSFAFFAEGAGSRLRLLMNPKTSIFPALEVFLPEPRRLI